MCHEVYELVQDMDITDIETQLALQCAPLIARLKISNLFTVESSELAKMEEILRDTTLSGKLLVMLGSKAIVLMYDATQLASYLQEEKIAGFMSEMGYQSLVLEEVLLKFQNRYEKYMAGEMEFPHEMGILLGYPIEDVEGFIRNSGKNYLYTGYWKVYADLTTKLQLFQKFEQAEASLIQMVSKGVRMADILRTASRILESD